MTCLRTTKRQPSDARGPRRRLAARARRTGAFALALALAVPRAHAASYSAELLTGTAYNLPSPLIVHQAGEPDIDVRAHYDTRPFGPDLPYFVARFARWNDARAWEFSWVHHRLFLHDPPPGIEYFAIHFGYNCLMLGRAWRSDGLAFHLGAGPILTNPDTVVRGHELRTHYWFFDGGYYYSGLALGLAAERSWRVSAHTRVTGEVALISGFAWDVPVANGRAEVPTVGLHFQLGVGYER